MYACINPVTNTVYANKFQIGSNINGHSHISHLSALEYYGFSQQVKNIVYVSSPQRFNAFEFEGITFKHMKTDTLVGVVEPPYTHKLKITDLEKTMIDTIQGIDSVISLEELIDRLELIPAINEEKILWYLEDYGVQALYQKTGYLLSILNETLNISDSLQEIIRSKLNKGVTYLNEEAKHQGTFIKEYQIIVPRWIIERGIDYDI